MLIKIICKSAAVFCGLALIFWADARSEDWMHKSVEVADGGSFEFEFPKSWGKKPDLDVVDGITTVRFGPYGPRKKPFFLVHIETVSTEEPVTSEATTKMAELDVENLKNISAETDIPINDIKGPEVTGHYFSITDRTPKIGEFDYLTLAILGSGHLFIKIYFYSSDGAPDFGADAMQLMRSIRYTAPPPEPDGDAKKK